MARTTAMHQPEFITVLIGDQKPETPGNRPPSDLKIET